MRPDRRSAMAASGTNLTRVKDFNEAVILDLIRRRGALTRPQLTAATGLRLQTVSNITSRLLTEGLLGEETVDRSEGGRPIRRLRINASAIHAVGIVLTRPRMTVGLVNLAGTVITRAGVTLDGDEEPAQVLPRMRALVQRVIAQSAVPVRSVVGAGIGVPGPLDLAGGTILDVIDFKGWTDLPLRRAASESLGLPVIMDNDVAAAALGEQWRGVASDVADFVYVFLDERGTGAGLVLDGHVYRGARGNSGEIAHVQVDPDGPGCDCGARGCLGRYATPDGILREAREAALAAKADHAHGAPEFPGSWTEVVTSAHPVFVEVVERICDHLAMVVLGMVRILEPELVVLGGSMTELLAGRFTAAIERRLAVLTGVGTPAPAVVRSPLGDDAGVIGAATLVLHDALAPHISKLSLDVGA